MKLSRWEEIWARSAYQAIFAPEGATGVVVPLERVDLEGAMRETLATVPWRAGMGFRLSIWIVAFAPLFVLKRLRTVAGLGQAEREKVIDALIYSKLYVVRQLTLLFKAFGALFVFRDRPLRESVLRRGAQTVTLRKKEARDVLVA